MSEVSGEQQGTIFRLSQHKKAARFKSLAAFLCGETCRRIWHSSNIPSLNYSWHCLCNYTIRPLKLVVYISSVLILFCLAFTKVEAPRTELVQQYCNKHFDYCLNYPGSMFSQAYFSPNEDSLLFTTLGTYGQVSVIATPADHKLDSHQIFEDRMRALTAATGEAPQVLSIINGDDYYEVNFLCGGSWYHQKAGFYRTFDVLFSLQVPVNRPDLMTRLKQDVKIEFL